MAIFENDVEGLKILLIEDDVTVQTLVKVILQHRGNRVKTEGTAIEGITTASEEEFDIILLDMQLPDGNGYDICEEIRRQGNITPVLVLSAVQQTETKIKLLKAGADDYLTKPFNSEELLARMDAILRRSKKEKDIKDLVCGEIGMDLIERTTTINGIAIDLTRNEFNLLLYFLRNKGRIISLEELGSNVWGIHFDTQTNYINVYVSYLRKKIAGHTPKEYIKTIRKRGYCLRCNPDKKQGEGEG